MADERCYDAYGTEIKPGFYDTDAGGLVKIEKKESGELIMLDSVASGKELIPTPPFTKMLRPILDVRSKARILRDQANWLEQLIG